MNKEPRDAAHVSVARLPVAGPLPEIASRFRFPRWPTALLSAGRAPILKGGLNSRQGRRGSDPVHRALHLRLHTVWRDAAQPHAGVAGQAVAQNVAMLQTQIFRPNIA